MNKKVALFLTILFTCFLFTGCNDAQPDLPTEESTESFLSKSTYVVNEFEQANITNVSVSGTTVSLTIAYTGENELLLGEEFAIEVYIEGEWYKLPINPDICWQQVAYPVKPNQSRTMEYNWKYAYNDLGTGKYRIVTSCSDFIETGNYTEHYLAAEFEIE